MPLTIASSADKRRLTRAQVAFRENYSRCFWHMKRDLVVTEENLPVIIEDLKLYGGRKGWLLAYELCP